MSKRFEYERFNMVGVDTYHVDTKPDAEGEWVKAQDALDREAVLQAQIHTLEVQLKDARAAHAGDKARLDSGCIMTHGYSELHDEFIATERRGLDLRAAIDAAMESAKKDHA